MNISVNDLRRGVIFLQDGKYYQVEAFKRHKMARGKGVVRVEARDLETGSLRELTFRSGESVAEVEARRYNLEFVYYDERKGELNLADMETKERLKVKGQVLGDTKDVKYLSEGTEVMVTEVSAKGGSAFGREIVSVEIPPTVELRVAMAPPGDKGDTAGSATKVVELETGLKVEVPLFVEAGDVVKVNTKSGEYIGRTGR